MWGRLSRPPSQPGEWVSVDPPRRCRWRWRWWMQGACLLACLHAYMHLSLSLSLMRAYFRLRLCLCHHHHKSNLFIFIVFFRLSVRLSCPLAGEVTFPCLPILYSFALVLSFSANLNLATLEGREGPWDLGAKFTHSGAQKPSPLYPPPSPTTHQCNKE